MDWIGLDIMLRGLCENVKITIILRFLVGLGFDGRLISP